MFSRMLLEKFPHKILESVIISELHLYYVLYLFYLIKIPTTALRSKYIRMLEIQKEAR